MANGAPPEHRGISDEQILAELLSTGPEGRLATPPGAGAAPQQVGFAEGLFGPTTGGEGDFLAGQNLLQRLGFAFGATGAGLQGRLTEFEAPFLQAQQQRQRLAQQESQFQRELDAGFQRLEQEQAFAREMKQFDIDMELFRETGSISPELRSRFEASGTPMKVFEDLAKSKIEFNEIALQQKRFEAEFNKAREKALKDPETRDFLLGLRQPPNAVQGAMLKWLSTLPPDTAARLAPMVLGGLTAEQMLTAKALSEGKSLEDILALLRTGEADAELASLTRIVTALATAQAGGVPLSEDLLQDFNAIMERLFEKLKIKRPPTKAQQTKAAGTAFQQKLEETMRSLEKRGLLPGIGP